MLPPELQARLVMKEATDTIPTFLCAPRISFPIACKLRTLLTTIAQCAPPAVLVAATEKYQDIPDMRGVLWTAIHSLENHVHPTKDAAPYGILQKVQRGLMHCLSTEPKKLSTYEQARSVSVN